MGNKPQPIMKKTIIEKWVDYNNHLNDSAYALLFSLAVENLMDSVGLDEEGRKEHQYTIYTLETHLCYLKEVLCKENIGISLQLLNRDKKRLHVFFVMENEACETVATSEQMLMGIDMKNNRPAPFPGPVNKKVDDLERAHEDIPWPKNAGRSIRIP